MSDFLTAQFPVAVLQVLAANGFVPGTGVPTVGWNPIQAVSLSVGDRPITNTVDLWEVGMPRTLFNEGIYLNVSTADAGGLYSMGLYNASGNLVFSSTPSGVGATGLHLFQIQQTVPLTIEAGKYYIAITGNSNALIYYSCAAGNPNNPIIRNHGGQGATVNGVLPSTTSLVFVGGPAQKFPSLAIF